MKGIGVDGNVIFTCLLVISCIATTIGGHAIDFVVDSKQPARGRPVVRGLNYWETRSNVRVHWNMLSKLLFTVYTELRLDILVCPIVRSVPLLYNFWIQSLVHVVSEFKSCKYPNWDRFL